MLWWFYSGKETPMVITLNGNVQQFFFLCCSPMWALASSFLRFLDHTQRRITVGRTPLDEWSACCRDPYLKTHNTHNRQTSMPPVGFEPTISVGVRPQTYALDRAATGTGNQHITLIKSVLFILKYFILLKNKLVLVLYRMIHHVLLFAEIITDRDNSLGD